VDQRIFDAFASMSLQLLAELASLCHVAPTALRIKSMLISLMLVHFPHQANSNGSTAVVFSCMAAVDFVRDLANPDSNYVLRCVVRRPLLRDYY